MIDLTHNALIAKLSVRGWTGQTIDRDVTNEVARIHGAGDEAGRYQKRLMPPSAFGRLKEVASDMRKTHYRITLPWDDAGHRLLPISRHMEYVDAMDKGIVKYNEAKALFIQTFDQNVTAAQRELGTMFKPEEFPKADKLEQVILARYFLAPVPDPKHFVVDLANEEISKLQNDLGAEVEGNVQRGVDDLGQRIMRAVGQASDRLTLDPEGNVKVFKDSLVLNLREAVEDAESLNITGNQAISEMGRRLAEAIEGVEPSELRERSPDFDPDKHGKVRETTQDLERRFAGLFSPTA